MNIEYKKDISGITEDMLEGFFVGWQNPPSPVTHLKILNNSYCSFIAIDTDHNKVIGFINAISDGVLSVYIPLLEVLPEYQGLGIGSQLVKLILNEFKDIYMIDICHDENLIPYYEKFGAHKVCGSVFRNYSVY